MEESRKIDPKHAGHLDDPRRRAIQDPDLIWSKMGVTHPQVLVDIGAGTGFFAFAFWEKLTGGKIYACDVSEKMLAKLREKMRPEHRGTVIPTRMEESAVPLEDAVADLVYMVNLHHELEEPEKIVKEACRLLKDGATLAIIDWKKDAPFGPPVSIRVAGETIRAHMCRAGISEIVVHDDLPYHNFLVGVKGVLAPVGDARHRDRH